MPWLDNLKRFFHLRTTTSTPADQPPQKTQQDQPVTVRSNTTANRPVVDKVVTDNGSKVSTPAKPVVAKPTQGSDTPATLGFVATRANTTTVPSTADKAKVADTAPKDPVVTSSATTKAADRSAATDTVKKVDAPDSPRAKEKAAVAKMRELVQSGQIERYYEAAIGAVDNAELKAEAMKLFESLPKINAAAKAEELVDLGLWTRAPNGIDAMLQSPRYLPGRRLLVPTSLNPEIFSYGNAFLTYLEPDKGGKPGVTPRGVLMGEKGTNFLVKLDGKEELIEVSKNEIYKYNHPTDLTVGGNPDRLEVSGGGYTFGRTDYNDAFTKAKVCEAAIRMDSVVGQIDFEKALAGNTMGKTAEAKEVVRLQQEAVRAVHKVIDMTYYHGEADKPSMEREKRPHAAKVSTGRAAIKGTGKCHDHASVNLGLLTPFARILGIDIKMFYGHCYRGVEKYGKDEKLPSDISKSDLLVSADGSYLYENPFEHHPARNRDYTTKEIRKIKDPKTGEERDDIESAGHSWLHLSFRPALNVEIVSDQTWGQPIKNADEAYTTRSGDRCPIRSWFAPRLVKLQPTDVNFNGSIVVDTPGVIFGKKGDGRENHIGRRASPA